jgi:hypothetical protein
MAGALCQSSTGIADPRGNETCVDGCQRANLPTRQPREAETDLLQLFAESPQKSDRDFEFPRSINLAPADFVAQTFKLRLSWLAPSPGR